MKYTLLIITLFLINFSQAQTAEEYLKSGNILIEAGNIKNAIVEFDKAITADANCIQAYVSKSKAYHLLEEYNREFETLNDGLKANPSEALLYYYRGDFYNNVGKEESAIRDFDLAVKFNGEKDSMYYEILFFRADAYRDMRNFKASYEDLKLCYEYDTLNIDFLNDLALTADEYGKGDESLRCLLKIVEIDSMFAPAYVNIGFYYQRHEEFEKSIPYFNKAISIDPEEAYSYSNRAYSRMKTGDLDGALIDINKSIELNKYNSYAYRNRGLIYTEMGITKKACKDWQTALGYNFTKYYGNEVELLQRKYCK